MKIIIGLGNPGEKFKNTRHNTGFMLVEALAKKLKLGKWQLKKKLKAEILKDKDLFLVKPQIFMNESGVAVKKIMQYHNLLTEQLNNLYIIHDELDLALGEYKTQFGRSAAGHKGVESVIKELGTKDFWRIRIGIGPNTKPSEEFVLEKFRQQEKEVLDKIINKVTKDLTAQILKNADWQRKKKATD